MTDEGSLGLLRCPDDKTPLRAADAPLLERLNRAVARGKVPVRNRGGRIVAEPIAGGLVRADGKFLYPIVDGIHVLLVEEAIALEQLG